MTYVISERTDISVAPSTVLNANKNTYFHDREGFYTLYDLKVFGIMEDVVYHDTDETAETGRGEDGEVVAPASGERDRAGRGGDGEVVAPASGEAGSWRPGGGIV